jgi:Xaa-Pro aminopeptidase
MRKSAAIAASGLQLAMQRTHPGVFEFQIASTFGVMGCTVQG